MLIHRTMPKAFFRIFILFLALVAVDARLFVPDASANVKGYHRLIILGDPHLPGKEIVAKERVIRNINSWDDVDGVIVLGDICSALGREHSAFFTGAADSELR